jgi:hypothetical protein
MKSPPTEQRVSWKCSGLGPGKDGCYGIAHSAWQNLLDQLLPGKASLPPIPGNQEREGRPGQAAKIEYELSLGQLQLASRLPLVPFLEAFCQHQKVIKTFKSHKNDLSRLRVLFGLITTAMIVNPPCVTGQIEIDHERAK